MYYYKRYFQKEIKVFSFIILIVSLLGNILELFLNFTLYPFWVHSFTYIIIIAILFLMLAIATKRMSAPSAFIIFAHLFTLNIYIPAFGGSYELKQSIISDFTNVGACFAIAIFCTFVGKIIQAIILTLLNIAMILILYFLNIEILKLDTITLFIFIFAEMIVIFITAKLNTSLRENEDKNRKIKEYEDRIINIKFKEEQKRISFLSMVNRENKNFIQQLIKKLSQIMIENFDQKKNALLKDEINNCREHKIFISQLYFDEQIRTIDLDFYARIKERFEQLTESEIHICALLRYNLSNKEIAHQLKRSVETIKWYRKRIRKKLDLSKEINLNRFLNKIN